MFSHYLKTGIRNLLKYKVFSVINIAGLSIGITCCVLLSLFITDELSFDRHFPGAERIYRITSTMKASDGTVQTIQRTSPPIGPTMLAEFPELESVTRVIKDIGAEQQLLTYKDKSFYEKRGYQVDSTFFDIFPYELLEGDITTAFDAPASVVLSERVAKKLFGDHSALDELITISTSSVTDSFRVTGVIRQTNQQSHLDADYYISGLARALQSNTTWASDNFVFTYLKLKEKTSVSGLLAKFPDLMHRYGEKENRAMGREKILGLQLLTDVHLHSTHFNYQIELGTPGSITYIYVTASIGTLILILACINFINLTTAKASQRGREVGVRKALGAQRKNLVPQFIGECVGIAGIAMLLSLLCIKLFLPFFNELLQKNFALDMHNTPYILGALIVTSLLAGLAAGIYPAFVLSSFEPMRVLKDNQLRAGSFDYIRRGLSIFQFTIAIVLLSTILIIRDQLSFLQNKSLGFDSDYKIIVPLRTTEAMTHYQQFENATRQVTGVAGVTATSNLPSTPVTGDWNFYPAGASPDAAVGHYIVFTGEDYFRMMNIPLIAGRDFTLPGDEGIPNQPRKVIVNRASIKKMGIAPEHAAGTILLSARQNQQFEIVGVTEDFHQFSLHEAIDPIIFYASSNPRDFLYSLITIKPGGYEQSLAQVKGAWKKIIPDTPFESQFLDDSISRQYENDKRVSRIISTSTVLAIIISCLGLYGLSSFVAERRAKEIGIRKVLGATIGNITTLLSAEFLWIVLISFMLAFPISYWAIGSWLETFAYRIEPGIAAFVSAGALGCIVAAIAIGLQLFKAALANPINILKAE